MPTIPDTQPSGGPDVTVGGVLFALAELAVTVSYPRGRTEAAALARTLDGLASDLTTVAASLRASPPGTQPQQARARQPPMSAFAGPARSTWSPSCSS
ncbi:MAG TPA: hypothetical protein VMV17_13110 [Streptosporangiaceae bacterium]|nr:hypothetical protein [Streptosporangiaceae bacterium]